MPNLGQRNNNPGNVKDPKTGSFRQFDKPEDGFVTLLNDLEGKKRGTTTTGLGPDSTLYDFAQTYAPASDNNNPAQYTVNIANHMKVSPQTKLRDLDTMKWAQAVAQAEGFNEGRTGGVGGSYSSPPQTQPFVPTPPETLPEGSDPVREVVKGGIKGLAGTAVSAARMGESIANQTAGRVVSGVLGRGFRPMTAEERGDEIAIEGTPSAQALDERLKSDNKYQTAGKIIEGAAEFAIPSVGGVKLARGAMEAKRIANSFQEAMKIVSAKPSLRGAREGLQSMREGADVMLERGARLIDPLVKKGEMKLEEGAEWAQKNADAVKNEIKTRATKLIDDLEKREIQPRLEEGELPELLKKAVADVKEFDDVAGSGAHEVKNMFKKYISLLPKGRDILASDLLKARKQLDVWIEARKGGQVFDPARENGITTGLRALRQGVNDLIASKADDVAVKESLTDQSALYKVLKNVSDKGAGAIKKADEAGQLTGWKGLVSRHPSVGFAKDVAMQTLLPGGITGLVGGYLTSRALKE